MPSSPFTGFLFLGHPYMIVLIQICSTLVYKEVTALFGLSDAGGRKGAVGDRKTTDGSPGDRWSKTLNWSVASFLPLIVVFPLC